jgi:sortase A
MQISVKNLGRAFILAGALAVGYSGYLFLEKLWFQAMASHTLEVQMALSSTAKASRTAPLNQLLLLRHGDIFGRIEIPRIHVSVIVLEGSDSHMLRIGAGHIPGSGLPGMIGNVAIAAHRDTFFRPLRDIRTNDLITLTTLDGVFRYRVHGTEIVDPADVQVLHRTEDAELTLVTCYPFYYLGSAPKRFIVHARKQG